MRNFFCFTFIFLSFFIFHKADAINFPENIKIGLFYDSSSKNLINIESAQGFSLGYYKDRNFIKIFDSKIKSIIVRKDGYFCKNNSTLCEQTYDQIMDVPEGKYGPFHLQYYHNLTIDEALKKVDELKEQGKNAYIACIGLSINVWGECFTNLIDALKFVNCCQIPVSIREISGKRIQVVDASNYETCFLFGDLNLGLGIRPIFTNPEDEKFKISSKNYSAVYRGGLEFKRLNEENMTVINNINIEKYLYGMINREMVSSWPLEALKSQAVASRTYCIRNLNKHSKHEFDLCSSVDCQVYTGIDSERSRAVEAVNTTKGKVLTYLNQPISAVFSICMGPRTEDAKNVWGFHHPYLVSVDNCYEQTERITEAFWKKNLSQKKATEIMEKRRYNIGEVQDIEVLEKSLAGSVLRLKITGKNGEKIITRENTRIIFENLLQSQMYSVEKKVDEDDNVSFLFSGVGWGHGVGMSQFGAKHMAEKGFTYDKILKHYYTGVQITEALPKIYNN